MPFVATIHQRSQYRKSGSAFSGCFSSRSQSARETFTSWPMIS